MTIKFEANANIDNEVEKTIIAFLEEVKTLESEEGTTVFVFQDGKSKGYYIKCEILSEFIFSLLDFDAKLDPTDKDSFRANRQLLEKHYTYLIMLSDTKEGREYNDIILEYNKSYNPEKPLKIWGGQHRAKAIIEAYKEKEISRYHGFKIYFNLTKKQRSEIALISNTNIDVSDDLFDRLQEETFIGLKLRSWCKNVGLLKEEDFPDKASTSESINVKLARSFITNFYLGIEKSKELETKGLNIYCNIYEPYLCQSGAVLDPEYVRIVNEYGNSIWENDELRKAGESFVKLHNLQYKLVKEKKEIENKKSFRRKALTESVITAWSFISGLLQIDKKRLENHYSIPKTNKSIPDPLNAKKMSIYRHDTDAETYRGLGTRSALKDRQRMAQLFLVRSQENNSQIDNNLMNIAVSQVVTLKFRKIGFPD